MEDFGGTLDQGLDDPILDNSSKAHLRMSGGWAVFFSVLCILSLLGLIYTTYSLFKTTDGFSLASFMPGGLKTSLILAIVVSFVAYALMAFFFMKFFLSTSKLRGDVGEGIINDTFGQLKNVFMTAGITIVIMLILSLVLWGQVNSLMGGGGF